MARTGGDSRGPRAKHRVHRLLLDLKAQGHAVSKDSVHALLGHLVDAYLLQAVPLHTESEHRRNSNARKMYPADPGLIHAFDASGRGKTGRPLETAVFNELRRRGAYATCVTDGRIHRGDAAGTNGKDDAADLRNTEDIQASCSAILLTDVGKSANFETKCAVKNETNAAGILAHARAKSLCGVS